MTEPRLLDAAQVGVLLGHDRVWFQRPSTVKRLAEAGFPPRVKGCLARWDKVAIERWLEAQMPEALQQIAPAPGEIAGTVIDWSARLEQSALKLAAELAP